jgi:hypothetical protein
MLKAHFTNSEEAIKRLTFHSAGIPVMKCEFARSKVFFFLIDPLTIKFLLADPKGIQ